jgi:hypothetical protein
MKKERGKRIEIIATDPKTGEETTYPSVLKAAEAIGCSPSHVTHCCNDGRNCMGYKVRRSEVDGGNRANICFDCKKACGGCSWSEVDPDTKKIRFQPVEGWTATPSKIIAGYEGGKVTHADTYCITECPLFERDEPRKTDFKMLSVEQSEHFLENLEKYLRRLADV